VLSQSLQAALAHEKIRWTLPEQYHLTLRFFGNVDTEVIPNLCATLKATCATSAPLELTASGLGCFPNPRRARVLWVGINDPGDHLANLWQKINTATAAFGEPPDHETFVGHLTLGRIKLLSRTGIEAMQGAIQKHAQLQLGTWQTTHLDLMRSELDSQGAVYSLVQTIPLASVP
jgi:2'-5' RNA ligase